MNELITILGPTACGKTKLACNLAFRIKGLIISADSRQVYQGLDIGSGKDLEEYVINGQQIPYRLIDIVEPTEEYNVFRYQQDFLNAYRESVTRQYQPILCGGTGMYLQAVLSGYKLQNVPDNPTLRQQLSTKTLEELVQILASMKKMHNTTDTTDRKRLIRAVEIACHEQENPDEQQTMPEFRHRVFGLQLERKKIKERITKRLKERLESGMIEEVKGLIADGTGVEKLKFFGLEYKFITMYLEGELNYNDMFQKLNSAIHNFAKRQMTWFRKMEREGCPIKWLDAEKPVDENLEVIGRMLRS